MRPLKILIIIFCSVLVSSCSNIFYCGNTPSIKLVDKLPCCNCHYMGVIKPDLYCPTETYRYKLQCTASKCGANTVLMRNISRTEEPAFAIYKCPPANVEPMPCNSKTDISHRCCRR